MEKIKNFIKSWGSFIALCIVALVFFAFFVIGEFKCESDILRVLIGTVTIPISTASAFLAFLEYKMME